MSSPQRSETSPRSSVDSAPMNTPTLRPTNKPLFPCTMASPVHPSSSALMKEVDKPNLLAPTSENSVNQNFHTDTPLEYRQAMSPASTVSDGLGLPPVVGQNERQVNDVNLSTSDDNNKSNVTMDFSYLNTELETATSSSAPNNSSHLIRGIVQPIINDICQVFRTPEVATPIEVSQIPLPPGEDPRCQPPNDDSPEISTHPGVNVTDRREPTFRTPMTQKEENRKNEDDTKKKSRKGKRKRRGNKTKCKDGLDRLLSGAETESDISYFSTYDGPTSLKGNLFNPPSDVADITEFDISSTFNSTKIGTDFDCDSDSSTILRGKEDDPDKEPSLHESPIGEKSKPPTSVPQNPSDSPTFSPRRGSQGGSWVEESFEDEFLNESQASTASKKRKRKSRKSTPTSNSMISPPNKTSRSERKGTSDGTNRSTPSSQPLPEPSASRRGVAGVNDVGNMIRDPAGNPIPGSSGLAQSGVTTRSRPLPQQQLHQMTSTEVVPFKKPNGKGTITQLIISQQIKKRRALMKNSLSAFNYNTHRHDHRPTKSSEVVKIVTDETSPTQLTIPDLISQVEDPDNEMTIYSKGTVSFVIVFKPLNDNSAEWDIPSLLEARDFMGRIQATLLDLDMDYHTAIHWCNPWGNIPLLGLLSQDPDKLSKLRIFISTFKYKDHQYNTFLKEAMVANMGITVLLRSDFSEVQVKHLPTLLFSRNELRGDLVIPEHDVYVEGDVTRQGISKEGWRLLTLVGDADFLSSLSHFTENHWFNIGVGSIQIRGGKRKQESSEEIEAKNSRRKWNSAPKHLITAAAKNLLNKSTAEDHIDAAAASRAASAFVPPNKNNPTNRSGYSVRGVNKFFRGKGKGRGKNTP